MVNQNTVEVWPDEEIDATEEREEETQTVTYNISHYPADYTIKTYLDKYESGQLEIPDFQRDFVWGQVQASKLIESFLLGLPVPAVFLYKQRNTNKLLVLDGQQRIFSSIRYLKNEFGERIFRLQKVDPRWVGRTYDELETSDRYQLDDTVLRAIVVQQLDPQDDTSIYQIFERLNTGGVNLNAMEVRKCVYRGSFMNLLIDINRDHNWRKLIGKPALDKRLKDVEFVLRIFALYDKFSEYEKPMKDFLNNYMIGVNRIPDEERNVFLDRTRELFTDGCEYLYDNVGEKPFHIRGRMNYAVMDSTMACVFEAMKKNIDDFQTRFQSMISDQAYIDTAIYNTSDEKVVNDRFEIARKYLLS